MFRGNDEQSIKEVLTICDIFLRNDMREVLCGIYSEFEFIWWWLEWLIIQDLCNLLQEMRYIVGL